MDFLHTVGVLDADDHHEVIDFLLYEIKSLINQNGRLQCKILELQKEIADLLPLVPRRKKPIQQPAPRLEGTTLLRGCMAPSGSGGAIAQGPVDTTEPMIDDYAGPNLPTRAVRGSESTKSITRTSDDE
ncbi:hypothetical protein GUJ93_ZPchr0004g39511 [Zizania palustris]|uniref:Uncharacterized protein n=1 Tax=Zizania palustris TaxID=103762 RepID=A0A8J5V8W3_ZIZPA|nr:hypothetical protein GUJ93_ZPchr0004g39511 [Zizania palustris]